MTFASVEAFYADNEQRRRSGEADYGVWWYADEARREPWRVSWVKDTGEVYAVRLAAPVITVEPELTSVIGGDELGPVELLGATTNVEHVLRGWAAVCGSPRSLDWVRAKFEGTR